MAKDRLNQLEEFSEGYKALNDTKRNQFARLVNKLLNDNFIYYNKDDDKNDYYEILSLKRIIENYFNLMDFDFIHIDTYKIFYIQTQESRNRIRLKKLDTVLLLILRLLYQSGNNDVNSSIDINTTLGKLNEEVNKSGIYKSQLTMSEYFDSLRLLKRYKIIDYNFKDFKEDNVIVIYPTILYVVKVDNINMILDRLNSYIQTKEEMSDETSED